MTRREWRKTPAWLAARAASDQLERARIRIQHTATWDEDDNLDPASRFADDLLTNAQDRIWEEVAHGGTPAPTALPLDKYDRR